MDETLKSPFELELVAALRNRSLESVAGCPDPEELMCLADEGEHAPGGAEMLAHVVGCRCCRALYAEMRRDLWEAGTLLTRAETAPRPSINPLPAVGRWLDQLSSQVTQSLQLLQAPSRSFAFSTTDDHALRQELQFVDGSSQGSFYREGDQRWLHFEHAEWPAGSLILLEAAGEAGEVSWRQFAVLGEGWERAEAEILLLGGAVEGQRLAAGLVEPAALTSDAAELLHGSYRATLRENPGAAEDWRGWAASNRSLVREPAVCDVVTAILDP